MNNWISDISAQTIAFNKGQVQFNIHVLIEKEDGVFSAHCLEFDITADGKTLEEALQNIIDCMKNHIEFCIEMGNYDQILNPAPQEYWNKLLMSRPLRSFPFPENKLSAGMKNPIKAIDTYEVECCA
jgi:predicted RNase H-like HicB family nuclease